MTHSYLRSRRLSLSAVQRRAAVLGAAGTTVLSMAVAAGSVWWLDQWQRARAAVLVSADSALVLTVTLTVLLVLAWAATAMAHTTWHLARPMPDPEHTERVDGGVRGRFAAALLAVAGWQLALPTAAMAAPAATTVAAAPIADSPRAAATPGQAPATTDICVPVPSWTPAAPSIDGDGSPLLMNCAGQDAAPTTTITPVVVRRGDCLWTIVARQLGTDAAPAEVAREVARWYAANRSVIGPDPDMLLPGQLLQPPDTTPVPSFGGS